MGLLQLALCHGALRAGCWRPRVLPVKEMPRARDWWMQNVHTADSFVDCS